MIFPDCSSEEKKLIQIVNQLGRASKNIKNEMMHDNRMGGRAFHILS